MRLSPIAAAAIILPLAVAAGPKSAQALPALRVEQSARAGGTQEITVTSSLLGEQRTLLVRLPRGYESGEKRYPVLFLLDAEWHFDLAAADVELLSECSYVKKHPVPELIVVGIVNRNRNRDFTPSRCPEQHGMRFATSGGAQTFRRFLIEEVVPWVDRTYRTYPYRILAGWSLGGLFAVDTLLNAAPEFRSYLAVSPSLWWDGSLTVRALEDTGPKRRAERPTRLIVTLGSEEKGSLVQKATSEAMEILSSRPIPNVTARLVPVDGLGHNYSPKMGYFLGLAEIFADWAAPVDLSSRGLTAIEAYYGSLSSEYGFPVPVPEDAYSSLGWTLFEQKHGEEALEVFRAWVNRHPRSSVAAASMGSLLRELGDRAGAVELLRRAVDLERASGSPRQEFILDLGRDIDALQAAPSEHTGAAAPGGTP